MSNRRRYEVEATRQRGRYTVYVQAQTHATLADAVATLLAWQHEGWDRVALIPREKGDYGRETDNAPRKSGRRSALQRSS